MKISYWPYSLQFKSPFTIASSTRTDTKVVYVEIHAGEITGYGEAALPPYLDETQESVITFFQKVDTAPFDYQSGIAEILNYIETIDENNFAAKAALDMAFHDLYGKLLNLPVYKLWNIKINKLPPSLYTLGITVDDKLLEQKIKDSGEFKILKVKAGNNDPVGLIKRIKKFTNKKICVDVNQGWNDKEKALDYISALADEGVLFIEQPVHKISLHSLAWLSERSPVPIIADESFQTLDDFDVIKNICSGINVKLMKCGGLENARLIIEKAKHNNMTIVLGCMSESSCGVAAASHLTPLVDYADLDGPLLINNDPFEGIKYNNGHIMIPQTAGTGIKKNIIL